MTSLTQIKPSWTIADREVDLGDFWHDNGMDPDREYIVTGFFHGGRDQEFMGLSVDDGSYIQYYDRTAVMALVGFDEIWRIEQHEMECAAEEYDPIGARVDAAYDNGWGMA